MDAREHERAAWPWIALATAPALLLLAWQASFVWPFFSDDAFISLRYSERLLAGHGLTWTDGERVEGYSNLLWVLLCALLGGLGLDLLAAARLLGVLATAVAFVALAHAQRPRDLRGAAFAALAPLLAASTQVVLGWTCSGLEGPLVLCLLALGCSAFVRAPDVAAWPRAHFVRASVPFALLCWTRPDAPLWVATIAMALVLATRRLAGALAFAALPLAAVLAQLVFRVLYYGDVVPNTAHVKAGFAPAAWGAGLEYVGHALLTHGGLVGASLVGTLVLLTRRALRPLALVLALPVCAWLLYLVAIGGDHFPGRRLLHAAVAPLALLATAALAAIGPRLAAAFAALFVLAAAGNTWLARTDAKSLELRGETWEWQGREVGLALRAAFADQRPLLAVDAAGATPYYSGVLALDLLGLCDRTIATTPLPAWLDTTLPGIPKPPGHLHGNGLYVLERAPDLLLFGPPPGRPLPVFVSGAELEEEARFRNDYRLVVADLGVRPMPVGAPLPIVAHFWVRVAGACGVRTHAATTTIPAWLFGAFQLQTPVVRRHQPPPADAAAQDAHAQQFGALVSWLQHPPVAAVPDATGRWCARLAAPAASLRVQLAAGRWRAAAVPANPGVTVHCIDAAAGGGAADEFTIAAAGEHEVQLRVAANALPTSIERVELVRIGP